MKATCILVVLAFALCLYRVARWESDMRSYLRWSQTNYIHRMQPHAQISYQTGHNSEIVIDADYCMVDIVYWRDNGAVFCWDYPTSAIGKSFDSFAGKGDI